ncbi:hypothetical protein ACFL52_03030 [Candidatus Margulisiibacteriota bacterium]
MVPAKLVERIANELDLTKEELIEESLKSELRRRLAAYKYTDHLMASKYKMSFKQFEKKNIVKKKKFSFEVEEDYHNWDQAIDGIKALEKDLKMLEDNQV